jgi:hypothetical protein
MAMRSWTGQRAERSGNVEGRKNLSPIRSDPRPHYW